MTSYLIIIHNTSLKFTIMQIKPRLLIPIQTIMQIRPDQWSKTNFSGFEVWKMEKKVLSWFL